MQTLTIDLTQDWHTTNVSTVVANNRTTAMCPMRRPDMYYDPTKDLMYSLGGDPYQYDGADYNASQPIQLWAFTPNDDGKVTWELEQAGTTQQFPLTSNIAEGSSATSATGHYNLGGFVTFVDSSNYVESIAINSFANFNFGNQSWWNETAGIQGEYFIFGEAQYVPSFGEDGVILFIGGKDPSDGAVVSNSAIAGLDNIMVYDVNSNTFYKQPTTGAPIGRFAFCSVGAGMNSTASTYEM